MREVKLGLESGWQRRLEEGKSAWPTPSTPRQEQTKARPVACRGRHSPVSYRRGQYLEAVQGRSWAPSGLLVDLQLMDCPFPPPTKVTASRPS